MATKPLRYALPMTPGLNMSATPTYTNFALDASTDQLEWIFSWPFSGVSVTKVSVRYGARTGTPPTYIISLQGVDTTGIPDGVIVGGGTPCSTTFTPPASTAWNGLVQTFTFDNAYTPARGDRLALVIAYSTGTISGANNSSVSSTQSGFGSRWAFPYAIQNNAGTRTRIAAMPAFMLGDPAGTGLCYGIAYDANAETTYASDSTPDERAQDFEAPWFPGNWAVIGVRFVCRTPAASKSVLINLYDTDFSTVLQSVTWDGDHASAAANATSYVEIFFDEATLATLTAAGRYRIGFLPQETAANFALAQMGGAALSQFEGLPLGFQTFPSGGTALDGFTRTNAGAWSAATVRYLVEPIIGSIDTVTAGAGGTRVIGPAMVIGR